jgi:Peptidase family M28
MKSGRFNPRLAPAIAVLAGIAAGLWQVVPPDPPRPMSMRDFDIDRAMDHVREIGQEAHPNGSAANAAAREYVLFQLRVLGLDPQVQTREVRRHWDNSIRTVRNIVARLPGSGPHDHALLLTAHYDSSSGAPGAGDDAAGVSAILETLRVLKASGDRPERDIVVLFSDGEELGLLGAMAFCGDPLGDPARPIDSAFEFRAIKEEAVRVAPSNWPPHPWLKDVSLVLNFEARGAAGPSIMFETTPPNLELVRQFASADPHPAANSLSYEVYKLIRNDTDFTIFRRAGLRGLNFAFIADQLHYHRRGDTAENLSRRSLYHHGVHALALTRHFANAGDVGDAGDAVWFNVWRGVLAWYPRSWVWPLAIGQILLAGVALGLAWRRGVIGGLGVGWATVRLGLSVLLAVAFVFTTQRLVVPQGPVRQAWHFEALTALMCAIAAGVTATTMLVWPRRMRGTDLAAVGLVLWTALSIVATVFAPGASFLAVWPALFAAVGLMVDAVWENRARLRSRVAAIAMVPALMLLTPSIYLGFVALTLQFSWAIGAVVALATWLIAPAFALVTEEPVSPSADVPAR